MRFQPWTTRKHKQRGKWTGFRFGENRQNSVSIWWKVHVFSINIIGNTEKHINHNDFMPI